MTLALAYMLYYLSIIGHNFRKMNKASKCELWQEEYIAIILEFNVNNVQQLSD